MTEATREQAEDAVAVLDAVIARDRAYDDWQFACRNSRRTKVEYAAYATAKEHADEQIEIYRARYGATR